MANLSQYDVAVIGGGAAGIFTAKQKNKLIKLLTDQEIVVSGKTTFKKEFVTAGGVDCSQLELGSMESKVVPGLFFAGEVLDVDGITGGFNFQHAWSSGYLAAKSMTDKPLH